MLVLQTPCQAAVSEATLTAKLTSQKILPKGATPKLVRSNGNLRVEVFHYPNVDEKTEKIDALLIARTLLHVEPGSVDSIVTRFFHDSQPSSYVDVIVSNRDIVGADAGIMSADELLAGIGVVAIRANDSVEQRFAKYCQAADVALRSEDFREAENLFQQSYKEAPDAARNDPKYLAGVVSLAHAYSGREDDADEARVYQSVLQALPTTTTEEVLRPVRDTFTYYFGKKDYKNAETIAKALTGLETNAGGNPSVQYANDLQLLASCHRMQGRTAEARKEYEETLLIRRNQLGDHHPSLAEVLEGIGDCYVDEKNPVAAQEYFKQAKVAYDHAVVTKEPKFRISYEVYRSVMSRLNGKMGVSAQRKQ